MHAACLAVRDRLFEHVAATHGVSAGTLSVDGTDIVDSAGLFRLSVAEASAGQVFDETREFYHLPTGEPDENGQGDRHTAFAFVALASLLAVLVVAPSFAATPSISVSPASGRPGDAGLKPCATSSSDVAQRPRICRPRTQG